MVNFGLTWQYIQKKNMLNFVNDTSSFLKIELNRVQRHKGFAMNVRGYGNFIGFDVPSESYAESL